LENKVQGVQSFLSCLFSFAHFKYSIDVYKVST
jgi:hypothetical protein